MTQLILGNQIADIERLQKECNFSDLQLDNIIDFECLPPVRCSIK